MPASSFPRSHTDESNGQESASRRNQQRSADHSGSGASRSTGDAGRRRRLSVTAVNRLLRWRAKSRGGLGFCGSWGASGRIDLAFELRRASRHGSRLLLRKRETKLFGRLWDQGSADREKQKEGSFLVGSSEHSGFINSVLMDFFKIKKFGKGKKSAGGGGEAVESDDDASAGDVTPRGLEEQQKPGMGEGNNAEVEVEAAAAAEGAGAGNGVLEEEEEDEEDDDDFITNEVKRRLKELRKNSFMVLIPEEECGELEEDDGEEEGGSPREWLESGVADGFPLCGFDSLYDKYCERMLVFHKMIAQLMKDPESLNMSKKSPRSASKLASTLRSLSFKRKDELPEDCEQLQQQQSEDDPYQTLETAYVAHVSLSWEALHCTYVHLSLIVAAQPDNPTTYSSAAQAFQQFQVLLQRFIENEPFEHGTRVEIYARSRSLLSKLLQVPTFQVADRKDNTEDQMEPAMFAPDLIKLLEECILTFRLFLKKDKRKSSVLMSAHGHTGSSIQQVQSSLDKKEAKVKELLKKKKGWKSKTWPGTMEEVQLLFALIDIKVVSRVLRMGKLSKEQLLWCEEKMSKVDLTENRLRRDGSPILFPC